MAQTVAIKELDEKGFFPSDDRAIGDAFTPDEGRDELGITLTRRSNDAEEKNEKKADEFPPGYTVQTKALFAREVTNVRRGVQALAVRFGSTIFLSVLIGVIFFEVGGSSL